MEALNSHVSTSCGKIIGKKLLSSFYHYLLWPWFAVSFDLELVFCPCAVLFSLLIESQWKCLSVFVYYLWISRNLLEQGFPNCGFSNLLIFSDFYIDPPCIHFLCYGETEPRIKNAKALDQLLGVQLFVLRLFHWFIWRVP